MRNVPKVKKVNAGHLLALISGLCPGVIAHADTAASPGPCAVASGGAAHAIAASDAPRRRIYLVRHAEANYSGTDGKPLPDPDAAGLSDRGREQARATARWFCAMGEAGFDRVVSSDLPRARQTVRVFLDTMGLQHMQPEPSAGLREVDPARESVAEARKRILAALESLRAERWDTVLIVAHTLVDQVILSEALTGTDALYGRLEQGYGCVNILDVGAVAHDWVVRAVNVCPDSTLYGTRRSLQDRLKK